MKTLMFIDSLLSIPFVLIGFLIEFVSCSIRAGRTLYGRFLMVIG